MELLPILILSVSFAIVAAIGFAVMYWLLSRASAAQAEANQTEANDAAIQAAVAATLAERGATAESLKHERAETMQQASDIAMTRVSEIADAKLDARLRDGNEKIEKNLALGNEQFEKSLALSQEKLEKNLSLNHERMDAGTSFIEKQSLGFQAEMKRIEKMMTDFQEKAAGQYGALANQLQETAKVTGQLQQTTGGLKEALGSSKKRGNWGERMAQDVLTHAGLKVGINYRVQKGIESGGRPDFTFLMPSNMVLHMDVKFPFDNYLAFLEAEGSDALAAEGFRKQFVKDARDRVKELADRKYHEEADSVDTVILMIPNESVFAFVQENDASLMDVAMRSKIVLCGPSTLLAVLQVVRQAMDNFMLERQSHEILDCLVAFRSEWTKYSEQIDKHGKHMSTAMKSFEDLSGTRTNVLQRKLNKIDQLQAATPGAAKLSEASAEAEVELAVADNEGFPELREVATA